MIYADCEASGLSDDSYPIEIAWIDTDGSQDDFLINPSSGSDWDHWDLSAEAVHNLKREDCIKKGINVVEAAIRLNSQLRGQVVYTDAPAFDGFWIDRLFQAAQVERLFDIDSIDTYLYDKGLDFGKWRRVRSKEKLEHRALSDCQRSINAGKKLNYW
ncbi:hypothetical protein [Vibrio owensii]|uniref:hypothetical protein n=1 Tax=Vibrio owensii TaxID=696485 RepID=UPI003CC55082